MEDSFYLIMQIIQRKYNHLFALFYILITFPIIRTKCEAKATIYVSKNDISTPSISTSIFAVVSFQSEIRPQLHTILLLDSQTKTKPPIEQLATTSIVLFYHNQHYNAFQQEGMSLRELIINRQKFNQLAALALTNQKYSLIWNQIDEEWIKVNISQQNYQTVIRGFQLKYGAYLDYRIWSQYKTSTLTQSGFVPLFPTLTTGLYYARLYRSCNTVFSGEAGIGKSFSFCSFSYLCSFVLEYRHYLIHKNMEKITTKNASGEQVISSKKISEILANDKICKIVEPSFIELIPNVCYMNLKQEQSLTAYYDQIKLQFPNIASAEYLDLRYKINKDTAISQQIFKQVLKHIKIIADQKGIKRLLVIDEANKLFQLLRQLSKSISNKQQWKSSKTFKTLTFYDRLLKMMMQQGQSKFDWVFLNSSQYFQLQFITNLQQSNIEQIRTLITLFQSDKIKDICSKCEYSSLMQSQTGHFQLLNTFWFQILFYFSNFLQKKKNILHDSQLLVHKKCFNKTFNIPSRQQIQADPTCSNRMERWKYDVRQLQIRQLLQNVKNNPPKCLQVTSQHIFFKENPSQQQLIQFSNGLKLLKESIQSYRVQEITSAILQYLQKTLYLKQVTIKRFTMLQRIQVEAELYVHQMSHNPGKNTRYVYLKQSTFSNLDKQVLIQECGFGYFDAEKNQLTFSIYPQVLLHVIRQTSKKNQFTKIMMNVVHQMWSKGSFNSIYTK